MAERRMISKKVVFTDRFSRLTDKAKLLYLYLILEADDDGVVSNARATLTLCGANMRTLTLLMEKEFLEPLTPEVVVIKHWKMQNRIEKRKYVPSIYQKELAALELDENEVYQRKRTANPLQKCSQITDTV